MDKKDLSSQILEDIREKKIKPRPKWHFTVKNVLFAGFVALLLAFGSIAFSILLFLLINNDWDLRRRVAPGLLAFLFSTFPYIWLILFILFILISYFIFRKIKGGYRFKFSLVIILGAIAVLVAGSILYKAGLAKTLDLAFRRGLPQYQQIIERRNNIWLQPEQGILIGKVIEFKNSDQVVIIDPKENKWIVDISKVTIEEKNIIKEGWPVKIIGEIIKNDNFGARSVRFAPRGFYYKQMNIQILDSSQQKIERNIIEMRII